MHVDHAEGLGRLLGAAQGATSYKHLHVLAYNKARIKMDRIQEKFCDHRIPGPCRRPAKARSIGFRDGPTIKREFRDGPVQEKYPVIGYPALVAGPS